MKFYWAYAGLDFLLRTQENSIFLESWATRVGLRPGYAYGHSTLTEQSHPGIGLFIGPLGVQLWSNPTKANPRLRFIYIYIYIYISKFNLIEYGLRFEQPEPNWNMI